MGGCHLTSPLVAYCSTSANEVDLAASLPPGASPAGAPTATAAGARLRALRKAVAAAAAHPALGSALLAEAVARLLRNAVADARGDIQVPSALHSCPSRTLHHATTQQFPGPLSSTSISHHCYYYYYHVQEYIVRRRKFTGADDANVAPAAADLQVRCPPVCYFQAPIFVAPVQEALPNIEGYLIPAARATGHPRAPVAPPPGHGRRQPQPCGRRPIRALPGAHRVHTSINSAPHDVPPVPIRLPPVLTCT